MARLRGRLTYANVMATLAFFFALTGGALAGVKYLQASDTITQGDLAGSTYGTPVIANGKITSAKFDPAATAPNATKVGGLDVTTATTQFGGSIGANGTATAVAGCPPDRVAIHVVSIDAGPDVRITGELWSGLERHSDLQVQLANSGSQDEPIHAITLDCFGADG